MEVGYFCDKNREYIIENMRPVRPFKIICGTIRRLHG